MMENKESYFAGLIDSEGSLRNSIYPCGTSKIGYHIQPTITIEQHLPRYWAGMVDGDGIVTLQVNNDSTMKLGFNIQSIIQIYNTNQALESALSYFCKLKKIRVSFSKSKNVLVAKISARKDVQLFLKTILPYLILKKQQAELLLEIIERLERGDHLTKEGFLEIMKFHDVLSLLHGQNQKRKYSYRYFENFWGKSSK